MASRAIHPFTSCIVPSCSRKSRCFPDEWVCGEHWRGVDRSLKLLLRTKLLRRLAKRGQVMRWRRAERGLQRRMKRQAIERAAALI